jgi:hypothetical protein
MRRDAVAIASAFWCRATLLTLSSSVPAVARETGMRSRLQLQLEV